MGALHEADLFGDIAASPVPSSRPTQRAAATRQAIRAAIDSLRGDASISSIGIGRLARVVGGAKAYLQHERDAYAAERGEDLPSRQVIAPTPPPATARVLEVDATLLAQHPLNPRLAESDERLDDLADAIASDGQLVPVCVLIDPDAPNRFLILDGSRRHRAILHLRARGVMRLVRAVLVPSIDALDFLVAHVGRSQDWSDYERATFFAAARARGDASQALLARKAGLSAGGFSKAMAPARLPAEILRLIADRRQIRVLDAHRALMRWKADPAAVRAALAGLDADVAARDVLRCCANAGLPPPAAKPSAGATLVTPLRDRARALVARLDADHPTTDDIIALAALVRELALL